MRVNPTIRAPSIISKDLIAALAFAVVFLARSAGPTTVPPDELTVTSKQTRDLVIRITSADGSLKGGENSFCVVFQKRGAQVPSDAQNVGIDFALLVGRIEESPIRAQITQEAVGRYCGYVNLGKQYYSPAFYYVFVRYIDSTHKNRKVRLLLAVR